MFTQTPNQIKARFTALQYRTIPHIIPDHQQTRAAALAPSVQEIKPGIYKVGRHFIDLWRNFCTCREHRIYKVKPCRHRLALWLAEGIQLDDPDPAAYLKNAGVQQPQIIAWYAQFSPAANLPITGAYRIHSTGNETSDGTAWLEAFPLTGGFSQFCTFEDLHFLTPFYL